MRRARRALIAVVIMLVGAAAASADPITIISDGRSASVGPFVFQTSPTPTSIAKAGDTLVATVTTPAVVASRSPSGAALLGLRSRRAEALRHTSEKR